VNVNWRDIPIPEQMADLPIYKGMPIPYTVLMEGDVPFFKATDAERAHQCKFGKQCGICGKPLGYWIAFIASPEEAEALLVQDLPYHEECARYAMAVCPWLVYKRMPYSDPDALKMPEGVTAMGTHPDREGAGAPDRMALIITKGYDPNALQPSPTNPKVRYRGCKLRPPKSIEWFEKK
jgi:hypothetical protein